MTSLRRPFRPRASFIATLSAVALVVNPLTAFADSIVQVAGDIAGSPPSVTVTNCTSPQHFAATATLQFNGTGGAHWTGGDQVQVTASAPAPLAAAGSTVTLPAKWGNGNGQVQTTSTPISLDVPTTTPNGTYTVTLSASGPSGGSGNSTLTTTSTYTVNVNCAGAPPAVAVTGVSNGASYDYHTVLTPGCTVDGTNTPSALTLTALSGPRAGQGLGDRTATCTASNTRGTATVSATYHIVDRTPPVVTAPTNLTVEAVDASGAVVTYSGAAASDEKDGTLTPACAPASGGKFAIGSTVVTCSATDLSGNTGTATFTIKVQDTTGPVLSIPADQTLQATSAAGASYSWTTAATDAVDGARPVTCTPNSGTTFALDTTTTVSCSATDNSGNKTTNSFHVHVVDTTAPVITVTGAPTAPAEATSANGAVISYSASATDAVDGTDPVSCDHPSGSTFALGTTTVTCQSQDQHANQAAAYVFTVTVQDTTAPTIDRSTVHDLIGVEATGPTGAAVMYTNPSATDAVDASPVVACTPASGSTFALGTTHVMCTATDAHHNSSQTSFDVVVVDTTAPSLTVPTSLSAEASSSAGAVVTFTAPSATDLVDGTITPSCAGGSSGDTFPLGTTTISCTATDAHHNVTTRSFTVTVTDQTAPVVSPPTSFSIEATGSAGATVVYGDATAQDAVDGTVAATCVPASGSVFPLGTTTVACSATDAHHNTGTASFAVTVTDMTAPALKVPAPITAEATGPQGAAVSYDVTADDVVDGPVTPQCTPPSGATFPIAVTSVTCSATDNHDNTSHDGFSVTVEDTTPPAITVPNVASTEATGPSGAVVTYNEPTASDIVDGAVAVTCNHHSGDTFGVGTTSVDCTAADAAGNVSTKGFEVKVVDTTAPDLHLPADLTREATGAHGAVVTFAATATDLVDGGDPVSCDNGSGTLFPLGATKVTCSSTDAAGNTATHSFTVTIVDTTPPTVTVPDSVTLEAIGPDGAALSFTATAADIVDGSELVTCDQVSGTTFALGKTKVTCAANDAAGNEGKASFDVTVQDTTPPEIGDVANLAAEATSKNGAVVTFTNPGAADIVDGSLATTCAPASGTQFGFGDTTVTCSVTDAHGNAASKVFHVSIADTTAPTLTVPEDITTEATGPAGAPVGFSATALDVVDGVVTPSCSPDSGSLFAIATTTVSCSASDAHGNTASGSFTVTVKDSTPPVIEQPSDVVFEATSSAGAAVGFAVPSATDIVDTTDPVSCDVTSGDVLAIGVHTVTCTSTDKHGNTAAVTFTATVRDTTAPTVHVPAAITAEATSAKGAAVDFTATASDLVDGAVATNCTAKSGSTFGLGDTTVTCTATDAHHNTGSAAFVITVRDTTAPRLDVPGNLTVAAVDAGGAPVSFTTAAQDLVDGSVTPTCSSSSGDVFPLGDTTVLCTASDSNGNMSKASFVVTVADMTPPVITLPVVAQQEAAGPNGSVVTFDAATAKDNVDGSVSVSCDHASGDTYALGSTLVTCGATDAAGNHATQAFSVVVKDTTAPVIVVPAPVTAEATGPGGAAVSYVATATDAVDGSIKPDCVPPSGSTFAIATTSVTCSAKDTSGNHDSKSFSVTVQDTTAPALTVSNDITNVEATGPNGAAVSFTAPTASDLVDGSVAASCDRTSGSVFAIGTTTVNCSATDAHGNKSTRSFTVTVADTTAPTLTLPANLKAEATASSGARVSFSASASDIVDGAIAVACTPGSGSTFALGTTTVTCSATDKHGNKATGTFSVTVLDTTAPTLTLPSSVTASGDSGSGAVVTYSVSASDAVDGTDSVTCTPPSGSTFPLGVTTVSCTATDAAGNVASGTFRIAVGLKGSGFFQPINDPAGSSQSTFKQGSTIPAKFALFKSDGSTLLPDADAQKLADAGLVRFTYALASGTSGSVSESVVSDTASSGSAFRYDATSHQFIYNFGTKVLTAGKNYTLTYEVFAADGKTLIATHSVQVGSR